MSYYPEPNSHITDKVKVVLDLSNYAIMKELDLTITVYTSNRFYCFERRIRQTTY